MALYLRAYCGNVEPIVGCSSILACDILWFWGSWSENLPIWWMLGGMLAGGGADKGEPCYVRSRERAGHI